jgi:hypothetical protein
MMKKKYRLVLEFSGDDLDTYDRVVALEERLIAELETGEVDGHDAGEGVVNIFIDTRDPRECFKKAVDMMRGMEEELTAAGFRELDGDEYERLWPEDDSMPFKLK